MDSLVDQLHPGPEASPSGPGPLPGAGRSSDLDPLVPLPPPLRRHAIDMALGRADDARLTAFLAEDDPLRALIAWFGEDLAQMPKGTALAGLIDRDIAFLDELLTDQLNAVLHHERFRALEASWRGLAYLGACAAAAQKVVVRVLNLSWSEVCADFDRASDFDQSHLFGKVYNEEFGMPGGLPYGVLLCDYQVQHRPTLDHPTDDVAGLAGLAGVAAAAFAPAILGASPRMLGLDSFSELSHLPSLSGLYRGAEYARFERLRATDDVRFLGLVLPRVLMRKPYTQDGVAGVGFRYREDLRGLTEEDMCWGSAIYPFGEVLIRAFDQHGWFADICGTRRDEIDNGLVTGIAAPSAETDTPGVVDRFGSELAIANQTEFDLWQMGFMTVNVCKDTPYLVFHSSPSIQKVPQGGHSAANVNARLSAMLRYILCVSRFAHYAKVKIRDRIGAYVNAEACERDLQTWLHSYCLGNDDAGPDMKARYPLREASVEVKAVPSRPGTFACVMHLRPHFQLDQIFTTFKLVTDVAIASSRTG